MSLGGPGSACHRGSPLTARFLPTLGTLLRAPKSPSSPAVAFLLPPEIRQAGTAETCRKLGLGEQGAAGVPPHPPPPAPSPPGFRVGSATTSGENTPAPQDLARPLSLSPPPGKDRNTPRSSVPTPVLCSYLGASFI